MTNLSFPSPSLIGIMLSLASLPLHFLLGKTHSIQLASIILAVIGAIYVGFALQKGSIRQILVEASVASLFIGSAIGGMWLTSWIVPVAYVLHGFWDVAHHRHSRLVEVPHWYPPFCAAYDWLFAAGLTAIWICKV